MITRHIPRDAMIACLATVMFVCSFAGYLFWHQIYTPQHHMFHSDILAHLVQIHRIQEGTLLRPHMGMHYINIAIQFLTGLHDRTALQVELVLAVALKVCIIYGWFYTALKTRYTATVLAILTLAIMLVTPIWVPFFSSYALRGQGYPHSWDNSTMLVAAPFSMLLFFGSVIAFEKPFNIRWALALAALSAISCFIKPNFSIAYMPGIFIYAYLREKINRDTIMLILSIVVPTLLVLAWQYYLISIHSFGMPKHKIIIDILGPWSLKSTNIPVSICLLCGFPLAYALCYRKKPGPYGTFAWVLWGIALIQAIIFAETGPTYPHANFNRGYFFCTLLLFMTTLAEFLQLPPAEKNGWRWILCWAVFIAHMLSGLAFDYTLLTGPGYD